MKILDKEINFLGCYLLDFSVTSNNQESLFTATMSTKLVEDPNFYYLDDPEKNRANVKEEDKIKFRPPRLGTACLLKFQTDAVNDKYFDQIALISSYTYNESTSEKTINVEFLGVDAVLDSSFVILNNYIGNIYTSDSKNIDQPDIKPVMKYAANNIQRDYYNSEIHAGQTLNAPSNFINLFGYKEHRLYGSGTKPNLPTGGKFGAADINSLGYPVKEIYKDIENACNVGIFGGQLRHGNTKFNLKLDGIKEFVDILAQSNYRLAPADQMSLKELINKLATDSNYRCFIYAEPVKLGKYNEVLEADIKFKSYPIKEVTDPDFIKKYIESVVEEKPDYAKNISNYTYGKTLNINDPFQIVKLGDNVTRTWFADSRAGYVLPVWGKTGDGETAIYYYGSHVTDIFNPFARVKLVMQIADLTEGSYQPQDPKFLSKEIYIDTNSLEVRCADSGYDTWIMYHVLFSLLPQSEQIKLNYRSPLVTAAEFGGFSLKELSDILNGNKDGNTLLNTSFKDVQTMSSYLFGTRDAVKDYKGRTVQTRFKFVEKIAKEYYGKSYLVGIPAEPGGPENNFRWIDQDKKGEVSWQYNSEGAWFEEWKKYIKNFNFYSNGNLKSLVYYDAMEPSYSYGFTPNGSLQFYSTPITMDYNQLGNNYEIAKIPTYENFYEKNVDRQYVVTTLDGIDNQWGVEGNVVVDISKLSDYPSIDINPYPVKDSAGKKIGDNTTFNFVCVQITRKVDYYDEFTTNTNGFGVLCYLILGNYMNNNSTLFPDFRGLGAKNPNTILGFKNNPYLNGYFNMFSKAKTLKINPLPAPPRFISIAQKSTRYRWGPWWSFNNYDNKFPESSWYDEDGNITSNHPDFFRGYKLSFTTDPNIQPSSFGSTFEMNRSVQSLVDSQAKDAANSYINEEANITIAGMPEFKYGDKLFFSGPAITDMSVTFSSNGVQTNYKVKNLTKKYFNMENMKYEKLLKTISSQREFENKLATIAQKFIKPLPAVNTDLLTSMEANINTPPVGFAMSFNNALAKNLTNKPREETISTMNNSQANMGEIAQSVGFSPEESFVSSYEQMMSPIYIYNQRNNLYLEEARQGLRDRKGSGNG